MSFLALNVGTFSRNLVKMVDLEFDSKGKDGGCRALVIYKTRQDAERVKLFLLGFQ